MLYRLYNVIMFLGAILYNELGYGKNGKEGAELARKKKTDNQAKN